MLFLKLPFAVRPGLTGSRVSKDAKQFRLNLWVPGWLDGLNSQVSWGLGWPPLEMYIWSVYANIFTKQSGPFNSEENSIRGSFAVSEFGERIGKILIVLLGCKIFEVRMPQTTQPQVPVTPGFALRSLHLRVTKVTSFSPKHQFFLENCHWLHENVEWFGSSFFQISCSLQEQ